MCFAVLCAVIFPVLVFSDEIPYYSLDNDLNNTKMVRGGTCKYFVASGNINVKTGDILFSVLCKTDAHVEFNIEYNLGKNGFLEIISARGREKTGTEQGDESYQLVWIDPEDNASYFEHVPLGHPSHPIGDEVSNVATEKYKAPGIVYLRKGEMYSSTGKIWDMKIWERLVEKLELNKNSKYDLSLSMILKVEDSFYMTTPTVSVDYATIRTLNNVKKNFEKKAMPSEESTEDDAANIVPVGVQQNNDTININLGPRHN